MEKNKYFIAIVPPDPLQQELMNLKHELGLKFNTKGALRSPAHITLHMPFELERRKEIRFLEAIKQLSYPVSPFEILLSDFGVFEPRVLFVNVKPSASLVLLRDLLIEWVKSKFAIYNQSDDKRGFHPHITIAFRDFKKQMFYAAWAQFKTQVFSGSFICNEIQLLKFESGKWIPVAVIPLIQ
jgi:2'-5' RNA ligase